MAIETVKAVREAEQKAALKEKEAAQRKDEILAEAVQNAKSMVSAMTKEALAKAEHELDEVKERGNDFVEAAKVNAEKEVFQMKERVKSKEQSAIDIVLSHVIKN